MQMRHLLLLLMVLFGAETVQAPCELYYVQNMDSVISHDIQNDKIGRSFPWRRNTLRPVVRHYKSFRTMSLNFCASTARGNLTIINRHGFMQGETARGAFEFSGSFIFKVIFSPSTFVGLGHLSSQQPDITSISMPAKEAGLLLSRIRKIAAFIDMQNMKSNPLAGEKEASLGDNAEEDGRKSSSKSDTEKTSDVEELDAEHILAPKEQFEIDLDHVVSYYNIGWSANRPSKRNIGWHVATRGWPAFVRFFIEPQIKQGVRRFQLQNPFGAVEGLPMELDQFLHAQEAGLLPVVSNFVEAWKPITDRGIEVIAYVGCGRSDPDFIDLPLDKWLDRAYRSIQPCLDANMSIALDAASGAEKDSPTHVLAEQLREKGVRVYIEAKPTRFTPHWFDFNVIALDQTWLNSDIEHGHPQARDRYGIPNEKLTGEIIRMARPRTDETYEDLHQLPAMRDRLRDILDDGDSVSLGLYQWFEQGVTLRDLLYVDER